MGRGVINIQLICLTKMLKLPESYEAVSAHYDMQSQQIQLLVESKDISEAKEGERLPAVIPYYKYELKDGERIDKLDSVRII